MLGSIISRMHTSLAAGVQCMLTCVIPCAVLRAFQTKLEQADNEQPDCQRFSKRPLRSLGDGSRHRRVEVHG